MNQRKHPAQLVVWVYFTLSLCCAGCFLQAANFSPIDTIKNKYPLYDPRNPDCPCHLQQRAADKEFQSIKEIHSEIFRTTNAASKKKQIHLMRKKFFYKRSLFRFPQNKFRKRKNKLLSDLPCFSWKFN